MLDDTYFNMYVVDLIALFCFHPFIGDAFQVMDFAFSLGVVDLRFLIYTGSLSVVIIGRIKPHCLGVISAVSPFFAAFW
ncbi:hypothetical protein HanRHA438_Chr07g0306731 [Helianthus annuus]|nr:hypothetical protein HanHA300_Chr07g0243881 [Helianthus annuus]KAJ0563256.1 hypothetical protein HanHA89_Chr07g0261061 [Helianthus annuus]KAJ0731362.1 hypothetical protein HanOQP8_Chr07g0251101 [Helianthus annuus]KAJ0908107.1 hypothetical protein HanRHA438_Chr07g0306731 [Helianthus annuus]